MWQPTAAPPSLIPRRRSSREKRRRGTARAARASRLPRPMRPRSYRRRWNQPAAQVAIARSRQGPASDRRFKIEAMEAAAELPTPEAASARSSIAELTPGQAFAGRYACVRKDRLTARNGSGYLSLELRDRTGSIPARLLREPA